jgi:hypothetical protein
VFLLRIFMFLTFACLLISFFLFCIISDTLHMVCHLLTNKWNPYWLTVCSTECCWDHRPPHLSPSCGEMYAKTTLQGFSVDEWMNECMYVWGMGHNNPALASWPSVIYYAYSEWDKKWNNNIFFYIPVIV